MKEKILVTGGSGMLGSEIIKLLNKKGYQTALLSRNKNLKNAFYWDYKKGELDKEALEFADIIIHLAGENISRKRWTKAQKKEIYESRIQSTKFLYSQIKETGLMPEKIISASAIGYYGTKTSDKIFEEEDLPGNDFLSLVVKDWEDEVNKFHRLGIPNLIYRIGVIFTPKQAALKEMRKTLKFKLAFPLGSGKQYLAWVSLTDAARAFVYGIENKNMKGVYNLVSPYPIQQADLLKFLAKQEKAFYLPVSLPGSLLYLLKGEMASIILEGSRVSAHKLLSKGFQYQQPKIKDLFI